MPPTMSSRGGPAGFKVPGFGTAQRVGAGTIAGKTTLGGKTGAKRHRYVFLSTGW